MASAVKEGRLGDNEEITQSLSALSAAHIYNMKEVLCSLYQMYFDSERGSTLTFTRRAHFPLLVRTCTCSSHVIVKEASYLHKWLIHAEKHHNKIQELSGSTNTWVVTAGEG